MKLSLEVENLEKIKQLIDAAPVQSDAIIHAAAERAYMQEVKPLLTDYPPERSGQLYKRTGNLKAKWQEAKSAWEPGSTGLDFKATSKNTMPYASYVQGDKQAWMHKGRWFYATQIVENPGVLGNIESDFDMALVKLLAEVNEVGGY